MVKAALALYTRSVLDYPRSTLTGVFLLIGLACTGIPDFRVDASGDSLLLESDRALDFYREVRETYGSEDFIILTYEPEGDLFSDASLETLQRVTDDIRALGQVSSVNSILNVPLFESPPVTREELAEGATYLLSERTDRELAEKELTQSPLYGNRLVGESGDVSAIQVNLKEDAEQAALYKRRAELRGKRRSGNLSEAERETLESIKAQIDQARYEWNQRTRKTIGALEAITERYSGEARMLVGGLPAINIYMLDYIRHDLVVFGGALAAMLVLILAVIFGKPRWVIVPLGVCGAAMLTMAGVLGLAGWPVTVVSSNFMALILILTLSLTIHLAVRYRELRAEVPRAKQRTIVRKMVASKFLPSLLTALTTMVAFASLVVSDIRPVIDFGWMMVAGIAVGFVLTFLMLPPALMLVKRGQKASANPITDSITGVLGGAIRKFPRSTFAVYALLLAVGAVLVSQLSVDNRFTDYFKRSTEVYQGLSVIDDRLGGTTPLEIILDGEAEEEAEEEDDFLAGLPDVSGEAGFATESYWYNTQRLETIERIHQFLESQPAVGNVMSLDVTAYAIEQFTQGTLDDFSLSIAYKRMPDEVKAAILDPYLAEDGDQARIAARIYETRPDLDRTELLRTIRTFVTEEVGIDAERVHVTGLFVLYNNVLQSLLRSQVFTAVTVMVAVMLMFWISFRSAKVAFLATIPNVTAAVLVLAIMSAAGLPLDIMTITIAAVAIGIGVDDTIHYVHRYQDERPRHESADATIRRCHDSVGRAIYFTSLVIVLGFSVLALSKFVPTVYFGLLTGVAMVVALVANLTLLPLLLARFGAFER